MKILSNLSIPALGEEYDILLPDFLPVRALTPLLAETVRELSEGRYVSSGHELLCLKERGAVLDETLTLADLNVRNGDHLILF